MIFKGIQKTSLIEYPGKLATVLFVGGCNFRCPICHNADLVLNPDKLPTITEDEVFELLNKRQGVIEAVVISGGEPTLNPELPDFIKKIKALGLLVEMETNGTNFEMVKNLMAQNLVDYWAVDIKAPLSDPDLYYKIIGQCGDKSKILDNISKTVELIKNSDCPSEFRTTYVPDLLDEAAFLKIASDLKGAKRYAIVGFRPVNNLDANFSQKMNWPEAVFLNIKDKIKDCFGEIVIRN